MYLYTHVIAALRQRDEVLKYTQEQCVTHKTTLQHQISERDTEIDKLRNQVSPPYMSLCLLLKCPWHAPVLTR